MEIEQEYLGLATPVYFLGESHTLCFRNTLFRQSATSQVFLGRVRYRQILAANFAHDGVLHSDLIAALNGEQLLGEDGLATHQAKDGLNIRTAEISGIAASVPLLVLFAGDLDLFEVLRKLGANYDFQLPEDPGFGINPALEEIPYADVLAQIGPNFSSFLEACVLLKQLGFTRLAIHALPPRTLSTAQQAWSGATAEAQVRAKMTILVNRILSKVSEAAGARFINTWPQITENGYIKNEFCLDGIHLSRSASLISWQQIIAACSI